MYKLLMNRKVKISIFIAAAITLLVCATAFAADEISDGNDKISLQTALEKKTTEILSSLLGHDKFIVTIDLTLNRARYETYKESWKSDGSSLAGGRSNGYNYTLPAMQDEALPGIPQKQSFESKNIANPFGAEGMIKTTNRSINMPGNIFKKMDVTILMDKSAKASEVKTVKTMVPVILGMDTKRGDFLKVTKVPLKSKSIFAMLTKNDSLPMTILKYGSIFAVIAGLIMLFFSKASELVKDLAPYLDKSDDKMPNNSFGKEDKEKEEDVKDDEEKTKEDGSRYFSFIKESDANKLKYYLKNKDTKTIAAILLYMDPMMAANVLAKLPREIRESVAITMSTPMQLSPEVLTRLEEDVKNGVAGTAGGIEEFMKIFNNLPGHETHQILDSLERHNPVMAKMVRKLKLTLEDIINLPENELESLLVQCKPKDIAMLLKSLRGPEADKIRNSLNEEALEMVNDWIELGINTPKKKIDEAVKSIVQKARELSSQGMIASIGDKDQVEEIEYTESESKETVILKNPRNEAKPSLQIKAEQKPQKAEKEVKKEKGKEKNKFELDDLTKLNEEAFEALLNEISPKLLSIALQQNGKQVREKIASVSSAYLEKLRLYDTIIGKQPDWKVEEAKKSIEEKLMKHAK